MALSVSKYLNYGVRKMSGGVKGVRYPVKNLNKYIPTDKRNYGIPYPVINNPTKSFSNRPFDKKSDRNSVSEKSLDSYLKDKFNVFDISDRNKLIVSGKDSKEYLDLLTSCDVRIVEPGKSRKTVCMERNGSIIGVGIVNRFENFYSLIMDGGESEKLVEHFNENKVGFDITFSTNIVENTYLFKGPGSARIVNSIKNILYANKNDTRNVGNMPYQTNIHFTNQLAPNNSFSVVNTPQGYILSINKILVEKLFKDLDIELSSYEVYETNRIESGEPDFQKDLSNNVNPVEANLHSHFAKNYKYSKRGILGSDFYGKRTILNEAGLFKHFSRTRVMMYSCDKGLIPPKNSNIYVDGVKVGQVTSSKSSSYLKCIVAMGYIDLEKTFNTRSFSLAREIIKKVTINGNSYFINFL